MNWQAITIKELAMMGIILSGIGMLVTIGNIISTRRVLKKRA